MMLSRDGMVLGAHPEGDMESHIRSAWVRFAAVGDPERSYVEFPDQTWAFVRRGSYATFAVAEYYGAKRVSILTVFDNPRHGAHLALTEHEKSEARALGESIALELVLGLATSGN